MKTLTLFAIAVLTLLATPPARAAIDLQLPDAKERERMITALRAATGAEVTHQRTEATPAPFPTEKPCTIARKSGMVKERQSTAWVRSFLETLRIPEADAPLGDCLRPECWNDDPEYDQVVVELEGRKGAVKAHVALEQGVVSLSGKRNEPMCIDVRDRTDAILALLKQALPEDAALERIRRCTAPDSMPVDSTAPRRVASEAYPDLQSLDPPKYPDDAREDKIAGTVRVRALVGRDGTVQATMVLDSIRRLDAAAVSAVEQTTFKPAMKNGVRVPVWVVIPITFSLH